MWENPAVEDKDSSQVGKKPPQAVRLGTDSGEGVSKARTVWHLRGESHSVCAVAVIVPAFTVIL